MPDDELSAAIITYVGWDTDAALPGRHPERVERSLLPRVAEVMGTVDRRVPETADAAAWARELQRMIASEHPDISPAAVDALVALSTFEWR